MQTYVDNYQSGGEEEDFIRELAKLLASRGIRIKIDGCGCCGSPRVKLEIDGEMIVEEHDGNPVDYFRIDMLSDDPSGRGVTQ